MSPALLDTDTLSQIMKGRNATATSKAGQYLTQHGLFTFSLMTRFEILRGLKAKNATAQIARFEQRCQQSNVLPITDSVLVKAADFYADLWRRGQLISDADLIIAATAMEHGLILVTTNTNHFSRIKGLALDCWTTP